MSKVFTLLSRTSLSLTAGYTITLTGNVIFLIYIALVSVHLDSQQYGDFRLWFNSAALASQFVIWGTDVAILKSARKRDDCILVSRSTTVVFACIAAICVLAAIQQSFFGRIDFAGLLFLSTCWAGSNFLVAILKLVSTPALSVIYNAAMLRVARLFAIIPIILFTTGILWVQIASILAQIVFIIAVAIQLSHQNWRAKIQFKNDPVDLKGLSITFVTALYTIVLLRSDVILFQISDSIRSYQFLDYAFIFIAFLHISHQITLRNFEYAKTNSSVVSSDSLASFFRKCTFVAFLLLFLAQLVLLHFGINIEDIFAFTLVVSAYIFYFSFGPAVEMENLKTTSYKPPLIIMAALLIAIVALQSGIFLHSINVETSVAVTFVLARIFHILTCRSLYSSGQIVLGAIILSAIFILYLIYIRFGAQGIA